MTRHGRPAAWNRGAALAGTPGCAPLRRQGSAWTAQTCRSPLAPLPAGLPLILPRFFLPSPQRELGRRLAALARAAQQAGAGKADGAISDCAAAASHAVPLAAAEAGLQQALTQAADRIREFQRQAEHQAHALQLEHALAPVRAEHEEERSRLQAQLGAAAAERDELRQRVAALEAAQRAAADSSATWQQRAATAQEQLDQALQTHEAAAAELQQALAAAEARKRQLAADLQEAQLAAEEQSASLQTVQAAAAAAAAAADKLAAATAEWQEEREALSGSHSQQQAVWEGELQQLRQQVEEGQLTAAAATSRAEAAEQQAAVLGARSQQLATELAAAQQAQQRLEAALGRAQEEGAGLAARLAAAVDAAAEAQQQVTGLQQQLADVGHGAQNKAERAQQAAEEHRWVERWPWALHVHAGGRLFVSGFGDANLHASQPCQCS